MRECRIPRLVRVESPWQYLALGILITRGFPYTMIGQHLYMHHEEERDRVALVPRLGWRVIGEVGR